MPRSISKKKEERIGLPYDAGRIMVLYLKNQKYNIKKSPGVKKAGFNSYEISRGGKSIGTIHESKKETVIHTSNKALVKSIEYGMPVIDDIEVNPLFAKKMMGSLKKLGYTIRPQKLPKGETLPRYWIIKKNKVLGEIEGCGFTVPTSYDFRVASLSLKKQIEKQLRAAEVLEMVPKKD